MPVYKNKIRVAVTMGDPSGIGPAVAAKALSRLAGRADFSLIGDKWVFEKAAGGKPGPGGYNFIDLKNVARRNFKFGSPGLKGARASVEYLDIALELIRRRQADCLVTCPVSKELIASSGLKGFCGHTEYLAEKVKARHFAMMLLNSRLKVVLATRHIALEDVPARINKEDLCQTIALAYGGLKGFFGLKNPRLVVCGLNPHASDRGLIGQEENKTIIPAIAALRKKIKGISISGPLASDIAFFKAVNREYHCVVAMYHDQALIPLKVTDASSGVNITLGLGFVRTSPLHGTAFDIAARPEYADPASLIQAIKTAILCTQNLKKA